MKILQLLKLKKKLENHIEDLHNKSLSKNAKAHTRSIVCKWGGTNINIRQSHASLLVPKYLLI
jgi:hypothetical protein